MATNPTIALYADDTQRLPTTSPLRRPKTATSTIPQGTVQPSTIPQGGMAPLPPLAIPTAPTPVSPLQSVMEGTGGGGAPAGGAVPAAGGGAAAAPAGGPPQTIQGAFSQSLMALLNGPSPADAAKNVGSSAPVTAFNAAQQRNEARDRAFMAERAAADGWSDSGGFESGIQGLRAQRGFNEAQFAGEQAGKMEDGRRQELLSALSMAMQLGDNEAARSIQRELGMGQLNLGNNRLGFDIAATEAQMNMLALQQLLDGY
jgi:hypothetical protein